MHELAQMVAQEERSLTLVRVTQGIDDMGSPTQTEAQYMLKGLFVPKSVYKATFPFSTTTLMGGFPLYLRNDVLASATTGETTPMFTGTGPLGLDTNDRFLIGADRYIVREINDLSTEGVRKVVLEKEPSPA